MPQNNKIGLIAGGGNLPDKIISYCIKTGRDIFVIAINDSRPENLEKVPHANLSIGSVGKAIKKLKDENIEEIAFAGGLKRPDFKSLRPDAGGIRLLSQISKAKLIGDSSLLNIIIKFFEKSGFKVIGADDVLGNLVINKGCLTNLEPDEKAMRDIALGADTARRIGDMDIGQGVVIQDGVIIGVEAIEGTDKLIERCAELKKSKGGVLVKMKKPSQDSRIDLPTIGVKTIENANKAGLNGVAIESGSTIVLDRQKVIELADSYNMFVVGV